MKAYFFVLILKASPSYAGGIEKTYSFAKSKKNLTQTWYNILKFDGFKILKMRGVWHVFDKPTFSENK